METKNIVKVLFKNRAVLKADRNHLKDEKNRIISTPLNDINSLIIARYLSVAFTDVSHLVPEFNAKHFDLSIKHFNLEYYHIYSKSSLLKRLNADTTNRYIAVPSVANKSLSDSTIRHLFSNNHFDVHNCVSSEIPNIEHSQYNYFVVDDLDNVTPKIPVAYAIYVLTRMIDRLTKNIHLAKSPAGKAKNIAVTMLNTIAHCHNDTVCKNIKQALFEYPYTSQLGQAVQFVIKKQSAKTASNHHMIITDLLTYVITYLNSVLRTV